MKSNILTYSLRASLGLALACAPVTAHAQTSTTPPAASAPATATTPKPALTPYAGSITAINGTSVTIAAEAGTLTLVITPTTRIAKGKGISGKLSDFAIGDKVKGYYTTDANGAMSATKFYKTGSK